jgi:hypothetical protein
MCGKACPTERLSSFERTSASTASHKQRRRPQHQRGCFLTLALYQLRGNASAVGRSGSQGTMDILSWFGSGLAERVFVFMAPLIFRSSREVLHQLYIHKSCGCPTATSCQSCFQAAVIMQGQTIWTGMQPEVKVSLFFVYFSELYRSPFETAVIYV